MPGQIGPHFHETSGAQSVAVIFTFAVPSFFLPGKGTTLVRIVPLLSDLSVKSLLVSEETL